MILYTSDTDMTQKKALKTAFIYLLAALFCAFFGGGYELFSHEVYSYYMIYAFAFPLAGGTLPFLMLGLFRPSHFPNAVCRSLYHAGIATLTMGSIMSGVLEIYGTTNALVDIYWYVGIPLAAIGMIIYLVQSKMRRRQ